MNWIDFWKILPKFIIIRENVPKPWYYHHHIWKMERVGILNGEVRLFVWVSKLFWGFLEQATKLTHFLWGKVTVDKKQMHKYKSKKK